MPRRTSPHAFRRLASRYLLAAILLLALRGHAETLLCHVTYGGETRILQAQPVSSPYTVPVRAIGSYFLFRMVFQPEPRDLATIKIYVFSERDDGPALIHQLTHPYPPPTPPRSSYGFTGLNSVHEPIRDGEIQYWCELSPVEKGTP
ncbi:hypothetical protein [Candidatus Accumulibacter aalborgensis]|nr:hypothetical protein [Candidatus Accumulibacter aalborgensis]